MKKPLFRQITIIGMGLLGASLARAIRCHGLASRVIGVCRSRDSFARLKRAGAGCKPVLGLTRDSLIGSDLVILAVPVSAVVSLITKISPMIQAGCIVMDVGSTKRVIQQASRKLPRNVHFVGCHPMAGSEHSGPEHSDKDLFNKSLCFMLKESDSGAKKKCTLFWRALGSQVHQITAREHDRITARVSHLPHLVANALFRAVTRSKNTEVLKFGGAGLASMVRIAGSNPPMWSDILNTNLDFVHKELKSFMRELVRWERALRRRDPARWLQLLRLGRDP